MESISNADRQSASGMQGGGAAQVSQSYEGEDGQRN